MNTTVEVALIYLTGQLLVAVIVPILNYRFTKPHLQRVEAKADRVAVKVEEVAVAVNGATVIRVNDAYARGVADQKAAE